MRGQVMVINGGATFKPEEEYLGYLRNYVIHFPKHGLRARDWTENLWYRLGSDFEVVRPEMPNRSCAKYEEWKIWFEKFFPFLERDIILLGYGLGGTFLLKYLSSNDFPLKIKALFLVAVPVKDNPPFFALQDFALPVNLDKVGDQASRVMVYQSRDDKSVPFKNAEEIKRLVPGAHLKIFEDRGHFGQNELPELVHEIESLR